MWPHIFRCAEKSDERSGLNDSNAPTLRFELHSVEGRLQEMDVAVVGGDDKVTFGPGGILLDADEKRQSELFEDVIVEDLEFVTGKRAENGAWFGDVVDEEFVGGQTGWGQTGSG